MLFFLQKLSRLRKSFSNTSDVFYLGMSRATDNSSRDDSIISAFTLSRSKVSLVVQRRLSGLYLGVSRQTVAAAFAHHTFVIDPQHSSIDTFHPGSSILPYTRPTFNSIKDYVFLCVYNFNSTTKGELILLNVLVNYFGLILNYGFAQLTSL